MTKQSKADQQVERDEHDATVREGARQASLEKERAIDAAAKAERDAAAEPTAIAATQTFWQKFKAYLGSV